MDLIALDLTIKSNPIALGLAEKLNTIVINPNSIVLDFVAKKCKSHSVWLGNRIQC
jgi:hypothetical protein